MTNVSNSGRADLDHLVRAAHIPAGEPTFLLRGRDPIAAGAVRAWAAAAHRLGVTPAVIEQALQQADALDAWPHHRLPDAAHLGDAERLQLEYQLGRRAWGAREADGRAEAILLAERRGWDAAMASLRDTAREAAR